MKMKKYEVLINGAGVSGLALALSLNPQKFNITLTDKRDIQFSHNKEGRSINFTLASRGLNMLKKLGLNEKILAISVKLEGRLVHKNGRVYHQKYSINNKNVYAVKRSCFIKILLDEVLSKKNIIYKPSYELIKIDKSNKKALFLDINKNIQEIHADLIVGADGVFSKVREQVIQGEQLNLEQSIFKWEYLEFTILPEEAIDLELTNNELHVFPGKESLLIAIPNIDNSLSALLLTKCVSETELRQDKYIYNLCNSLSSFDKQFSKLKKSKLINIKLSKWTFNDSIALIGDSCHAVYPFYGQGMNSSLEDAIELASQLDSAETLSDALNSYELKRVSNTQALNRLSENHFNILFNSSSKVIWNIRNCVDRNLARLFPKSWTYEYEQVAHTNLPYDSIYKQLKKQRRIRFVLGIFILEWILASLYELIII